jgi:hypothetical protein
MPRFDLIIVGAGTAGSGADVQVPGTVEACTGCTVEARPEGGT